MKGVKKKEVYPLLEEFVSAVCTAIKLAFKRGAVPPALQASGCLCNLNCVKDERHRSVVAGTINTILPLLLGRGKDEGVREVSSDQRVQEYFAPQYMEILRWNASVVTPKHVKDIIGSIKMPFSRSSSPQAELFQDAGGHARNRGHVRGAGATACGQDCREIRALEEHDEVLESGRLDDPRARHLPTRLLGVARGHLQELHDDVLGSPWPSPEGSVGVREFRVGNARHRRRESRRIQGVDGLFYRRYLRRYF